jgi:hypothetical protein
MWLPFGDVNNVPGSFEAQLKATVQASASPAFKSLTVEGVYPGSLVVALTVLYSTSLGATAFAEQAMCCFADVLSVNPYFDYYGPPEVRHARAAEHVKGTICVSRLTVGSVSAPHTTARRNTTWLSIPKTWKRNQSSLKHDNQTSRIESRCIVGIAMSCRGRPRYAEHSRFS